MFLRQKEGKTWLYINTFAKINCLTSFYELSIVDLSIIHIEYNVT